MSTSCLLTLALAVQSVSSPGASVEVAVKGPPPKTIKGELVRQNLRGIVIKVESGAVSVPWVDVQKVNAHPVNKYIADLKLSLKEVLCPHCRGGLATVLCPDCLATGKSYAQTQPCSKCNGSGTTGQPCTSKACVKGKMDCPGPCQKASVGLWTKQPGATVPYRRFRWKMADGAIDGGGFSEGHQGEIWEFTEVKPFPLGAHCFTRSCGKDACKNCRESITFVSGPLVKKGDCNICGGGGMDGSRGKVVCGTCLGGLTLPCGTCYATKVVPVPESATACATCNGAGIFRCVVCNETGLIDPKSPNLSRPMESLGPSVTVETRNALGGLEPGPLNLTARFTLRDGRVLTGHILHQANKITVLAYPGPSPGEIRVLAIQDPRIFRRESVKKEAAVTPAVVGESNAPSGAKEAPPKAPTPDGAKPAAGPDTVILKDGTSVNGKIIARANTMLMVRTPEGKLVKIETDNVAEIRTDSAPKK